MRRHIRPDDEADESAVVSPWNEVFACTAPHNQPLNLIRHQFWTPLLLGRISHIANSRRTR